MRSRELLYLIDAKSPLTSFESAEGPWDIFLSAFNDTDRVQKTFDRVSASRKLWWLLPEYGYVKSDKLPDEVLNFTSMNEAEIVDYGLATSGVEADCGRVCIDITGFFPQHILYFLKRMESLGVKSFDMIYTEPESYARRDETAFSLGDVQVVRQVAGFEGQHTTDMSSDVLIVGVGYDHNLVGRAILEKESARLVQLQCLPSLSADMYNESVLRLDRLAIPSYGRVDEHLFFAPANDPFVTASVLSQAVYSINNNQSITNLYLTPLATKPQVLGFGLFFLQECVGRPVSIIYPFSTRHSKGSSSGVGRAWVYPVRI